MIEGEEEEEYEDPVKFLTRNHFEIAFQSARKGVNEENLKSFEKFKMENDPEYKAKAEGKDGRAEIKWPEDPNALADGGDDDMYD